MPTNINKIIESELINDAFIPNFSYFKIAENEFSEETLIKIKNAVSAVFLIENSDLMQLKDKFDIIASLISEEKPKVIKLLRSWFINFLNKNEDVEVLIETFDLKDKVMLTDSEDPLRLVSSIEKWEKIIEKRGKEEGKKECLIETAKKMKAAGISDDLIAECTGLSTEFIKNL